MIFDFELALKEQEVMEDIYNEIAEDEDRQAEELRNPLTAFDFIAEQLNPNPFDNEHTPIEVLEVEDVKYSASMNTTDIKVVAKVQCNDNVVRRVTAEYNHWSGNRMTPPETDGWVEWDEIKQGEE